jgi:hypothetical protein
MVIGSERREWFMKKMRVKKTNLLPVLKAAERAMFSESSLYR